MVYSMQRFSKLCYFYNSPTNDTSYRSAFFYFLFYFDSSERKQGAVYFRGSTGWISGFVAIER